MSGNSTRGRGRGSRGRGHDRFDDFPRVLFTQDAEEQSSRYESEVQAEPVIARSRIPAHIQPTSVRVIPNRPVSSTATQAAPTVQPEAWVADMALTAPELEPEPEAEPEPQVPHPVVGN